MCHASKISVASTIETDQSQHNAVLDQDNYVMFGTWIMVLKNIFTEETTTSIPATSTQPATTITTAPVTRPPGKL